MMDFIIYDAKAAVILAVFYMFYRLLLSKETFHRLNRVVLLTTAVGSLLLPLWQITLHRIVEVEAQSILQVPEVTLPIVQAELPTTPWWQTALITLFIIGAVAVLFQILFSIYRVVKIISSGEKKTLSDGIRLVVTQKDVSPFSWMHTIVLSQSDYDTDYAAVLSHERAHIRLYHSWDLLLVDLVSSLQWFNPAIWMLRADLQELHEFEADDAVLRSGANLKEYQYLLVRKAVRKSAYSVANSFNHSTLKNRIHMMSKSKSPLRRGFRALYLLPLVCLCIGLQAKTVYVPVSPNEGNPVVQNEVKVSPEGVSPLYILRQAWGEEKEISRKEFNRLDESRIESVEVLKDGVAKKKYGDKAANGVIVITLKRPQELESIAVVRYKKNEEPLPFFLVEPETMPKFQGEDMNSFCRWLNQRIVPTCYHSGTMKVGFVVDEEGTVKDVQILQSVCEELDDMMLKLVSSSPKWEPATSGGHPVAQFLTIPIFFSVRQ